MNRADEILKSQWKHQVKGAKVAHKEMEVMMKNSYVKLDKKVRRKMRYYRRTV